MTLCPVCCRDRKMDLESRQNMAMSLVYHEHYVCDGCGMFMYMSYSGLKYSRSMEFIMYHVEREQENGLYRDTLFSSPLASGGVL